MVLEPKLRLLQSRSRSNHSLPRLREQSTPQVDQENQKIDSTNANSIQRRYTFTAKDNCVNNPQREIIRQRFATKISGNNDSLQCPPIDRKGRRKSSLGHSILVKNNYQESQADPKNQQRRSSIKSITKDKCLGQDQCLLPTLNQVHLVQQRHNDGNSVCSYDAEDEYDSHNEDSNHSDSDSCSGRHQPLTIGNLEMINKCNKNEEELEIGYDSGINENISPPLTLSQAKLQHRKKKLNYHQQHCDKITTRIMNWLNDCQEKQGERQLPILFQSQLTNYPC